MDFDDLTLEIAKVRNDQQLQSNVLYTLVIALLIVIIMQCGWVSAVKTLFFQRLNLYRRMRQRNDHQHDHIQEQRGSVNAKSATFNFQTHRRSVSKEIINDSMENLRKSEIWVCEQVEKCNDLEDRVQKRAVLAQSIQSNSDNIVQTVPWTGSSFPDQLVQSRVILESECQHITGIKTGEQNKIRTLLLIILKSDYRSLLSFLTCIGNFNPQIKQVVLESMQLDKVFAQKCTRCLLKERVNINHIVDKLFTKGFVTRKIVSMLTKIDVYTDSQNEIWDSMLDEILFGNTIEIKVKLMTEIIETNGFHADIVDLLRGLAIGPNCLQCKCGPQMELLKDPVESGDGDSGLSAEYLAEDSPRSPHDIVNNKDDGIDEH